jgi:hypothetical protein
MSDTETDALTQIIKVLMPLKSEDRRRAVAAAMLFLGESAEPAPAGSGSSAERRTAAPAAAVNGAGDGDYPPAARKWMEQNGVSSEDLEQVFHFNGDGSFDIIHDAPGKSMRERTLNTYVLTGVGKLMTSNDRMFVDSMARDFCVKTGCYDKPNHSTYLRNKGAELSGERGKGYILTTVGMKRGAALVKELAGAGK